MRNKIIYRERRGQVYYIERESYIHTHVRTLQAGRQAETAREEPTFFVILVGNAFNAFMRMGFFIFN